MHAGKKKNLFLQWALFFCQIGIYIQILKDLNLNRSINMIKIGLKSFGSLTMNLSQGDMDSFMNHWKWISEVIGHEWEDLNAKNLRVKDSRIWKRILKVVFPFVKYVRYFFFIMYVHVYIHKLFPTKIRASGLHTIPFYPCIWECCHTKPKC